MSDPQSPPTLDARTVIGLGGFLVGCVVAGIVLGLVADGIFGVSPIGIIVGTAVGIVVAVVGSCLRIAQYLRR